jgi:hypothetical protein
VDRNCWFAIQKPTGISEAIAKEASNADTEHPSGKLIRGINHTEQQSEATEAQKRERGQSEHQQQASNPESIAEKKAERASTQGFPLTPFLSSYP